MSVTHEVDGIQFVVLFHAMLSECLQLGRIPAAIRFALLKLLHVIVDRW